MNSNKTTDRHLDPIKNGYYKHFWYILILPIYLIGFFIVESLDHSQYFISYLPFDDMIPFCEYFVIFYIIWFPFIAIVGLYLLIKDAEGLERYMTFVGAGFIPVVIFCLLFPNRQLLRPETFANQNIFTKLVASIYRSDTNTNVLPSVHVIGTFGAIFGIFENDCMNRSCALKITSIITGILICLSTVFIKQHSVLDGIAAIPYSFIIWFIVYRLPKLIHKRKSKKRT